MVRQCLVSFDNTGLKCCLSNFQVSIGHFSLAVNKVVWHCGGTLISDHFILTAASCVPDKMYEIVFFFLFLLFYCSFFSLYLIILLVR